MTTEGASPVVRPDFSLVRVAVRFDGAFGVLLERGLPFAVTLERTYGEPGGAPQIVKIPAGTYHCERTRFQRGGYETFEVTGVAGHSRLLFHRGNVEGDSEGCILVGQCFGTIQGAGAVMLSQLAFTDFMKRCAGRLNFSLEVRQA